MSPSLLSPTNLFFILLLIFSTSCYDDVKCTNGDYLFLRYMHNGQNAIFGGQAILERDSISFSTIEGEVLSQNLSIVDSTMAIRILLRPSHTLYLLHLGDLHTDTFQVTEWLLPRGRDCSVFIIQTAQLNGEVLCDVDCGEVIEVIF